LKRRRKKSKRGPLWATSRKLAGLVPRTAKDGSIAGIVEEPAMPVLQAAMCFKCVLQDIFYKSLFNPF